METSGLARWVARFEQTGFAGRAAMLGGGAVRVAALAAEKALDRAASVAVEARDAFRKEMDPNVSDARVIEETDDRPARGTPKASAPERG